MVGSVCGPSVSRPFQNVAVCDRRAKLKGSGSREVSIMSKRSYPLSKVYGLLEPGPVVLVTTRHKEKPNIKTKTRHTKKENEPPQNDSENSGRNTSFDALRTTRECAINI